MVKGKIGKKFKGDKVLTEPIILNQNELDLQANHILNNIDSYNELASKICEKKTEQISRRHMAKIYNT